MTRRYLSARRLAILEQRLTDRDRAILTTLRRVRLATGHQLERLHFTDTSVRQRRRVLAALTEQGLIARLPRIVGGVRAGSSGYLFTLDVAGQRLTDQSGPARGHRVQRPWTPGVPFIAHTLLVTELYVRLVEAERTGAVKLRGFDTEPACWRTFSGRGGGRATLKPDAYLELELGDDADYWFVEVDRGTESPGTLARKAETYRAYWSSGREQARSGVFPRVLFLVPDVQRYDVVIEALGRQPADSWGLYQVAIFDKAMDALLAGAAS